MTNFLIGLGIGVAFALVIAVSSSVSHHKKILQAQNETNRYKKMVTDRMDLENEGINKMKAEIENLKQQNENLRITVTTYSQKPGRKELSRLQVYQQAVDRLTLNAPGFGAAWQAALKESEDEFKKTYIGLQPFIKRLIPLKSDSPTLISDEDLQ